MSNQMWRVPVAGSRGPSAIWPAIQQAACPLRCPRVGRRLEEQSQLIQHLVEELWPFALFAPEEASQYGEGGLSVPATRVSALPG